MYSNFDYRRKIRQERLIERQRREQLRRVRLITSLLSTLILFVVVISANTLIARARDNGMPDYHKYYTQIYVTSGDSVWKIADTYMSDYYDSVSDLTEEIIAINQLDSDGTIYYGTTIVVPYYATEVLMGDSY